MLLKRSKSPESKTSSTRTAWVIALALFAAASLLQSPLSSARAQEKAVVAKKAAANRLSYNDGTAEGKRSIAGTGEMVSFSLPTEGAKVAGVRIHGSRYGYPQAPQEDFMIYLLSADGSEVVATKPAPYSRFKRGNPQWVEVRFTKPVEVPQDFGSASTSGRRKPRAFTSAPIAAPMVRTRAWDCPVANQKKPTSRATG